MPCAEASEILLLLFVAVNPTIRTTLSTTPLNTNHFVPTCRARVRSSAISQTVRICSHCGNRAYCSDLLASRSEHCSPPQCARCVQSRIVWGRSLVAMSFSSTYTWRYSNAKVPQPRAKRTSAHSLAGPSPVTARCDLLSVVRESNALQVRSGWL